MQKRPATQPSARSRGRIFFQVLQVAAITTVAGIIFFYIHMYQTFGATCYTMADLQTDSRCLYVYSGSVYEKGTRATPHHGNACGSDVTAIIPSFHYLSVARYLDPNLVGIICAAPTTTPTLAPTNTPIPAAPTNTPPPGCAMKAQGDADCDNHITVLDYMIWRNEFITGTGTTSDFSQNGRADLADYNIWRTGFLNTP